MAHSSFDQLDLRVSAPCAPAVLVWIRERPQFEELVRPDAIDGSYQSGWNWPVLGLPMDDLVVFDVDGGDDDPICI